MRAPSQKQKKRAKASLDPLFTPTSPIPPVLLQMDYMSSEYSSAGEDSLGDEDAAAERKETWNAMLAARNEQSGEGSKGGWAEGLAEKVLEVRTPRWRSIAVSMVYSPHSPDVRITVVGTRGPALISRRTAKQDLSPTRFHLLSTSLSPIKPQHQ